MIYAKATAYLAGWIALAVVLLRVIVGPLWGSGTDIGLVAAPLAFAAGVVGLGKLALVMLDSLGMTRSKTGDQEHE